MSRAGRARVVEAGAASLGAGPRPRYLWCMARLYTSAPTLADIEVLAQEAFATLPAALKRVALGVPILVHDFPDEETEREMELKSPFDLLGLYRGVPIDEKSVSATPENVDLIFLYRRPLLDYWCETGETLARVIRHVLIHEIGHHFGLSDEEMERIEAEA